MALRAQAARARRRPAHPPPGVRRAARNRQDHHRPRGRQNLLRPRAFEAGEHPRGAPRRPHRPAHRRDRGQDQRHHRQRTGRGAVPRRGLRPGGHRRQERLRPGGHRHPAGPDGKRPRPAGGHHRRLPRRPGQVPGHQRRSAVAVHPQHRLPVLLGRRSWSRSPDDGRASGTASSNRPRSTDMEALFAQLADASTPDATGSNGAASTSRATAGSSATSSNAPKRNANSGWTIPNMPEPASSPMRS